MGRIGLAEALLLGIGFLLIFSLRKLPEIGAALGRAVSEFRQAWKGRIAQVENDKQSG